MVPIAVNKTEGMHISFFLQPKTIILRPKINRFNIFSPVNFPENSKKTKLKKTIVWLQNLSERLSAKPMEILGHVNPKNKNK